MKWMNMVLSWHAKDSRALSRELEDIDLNVVFRRHKVIKDATIIPENERRNICARAIEAVSGREAKFTGTSPGISHYYDIDPEQETDPDVVQAYQCGTDPEVLIHITGRYKFKHTVRVVVHQNDIQRLLFPF